MIRKYLTAISLYLIYSCSSQDRIQSFIPGIYIRPFENELYKGLDTLKIESLTGNSYRIVNSGSFLEKKIGVTKHEQEIWTAVYHKEDHVLYETRHGKVISFDSKSGLLYLGSTKYQKI